MLLLIFSFLNGENNMHKYKLNISTLYYSCFISFLIITDFLSLRIVQGKFKTWGAAFFMFIGFITIIIKGKENSFKIQKNSLPLLVFIVIACFSGLINIEYASYENVKAVIWIILHYLLLYNIDLKIDKPSQLFNKTFFIPILIWSIAILYSIGQFINLIYYEVERRGQGFNNGRLYGIFRDPNYASIVTSCLFFLSLVGLYSEKRKWFYRISICLCMIYIVLCGSRGGWISIASGWVVYQILQTKRVVFSKVTKVILSVCISTIILFLLRSSLFNIVTQIHNIKQPQIVYSQTNSTKAEESRPTFVRTDLKNHTLSNGRMDIWISSIEMTLEKPLFGLSPRGLNEYANKYHPESYISRTGQNAHSGYIGVFVGTGLCGILIILIYLLLQIKKIFTCVIPVTNNLKILSPLIGLIVSCLVNAIFIQDIFIYNTISTIIFWIILGNINRIGVKMN